MSETDSATIFEPHGFVRLVKWMGDELDIVNAARVSLATESLEFDDDDAGLINYLLKNKHGSPFEQGFEAHWHIRMPIFVMREWVRHRIGHCLPGSASITCETYSPGSGRTLRKRDLYTLWRNWNQGVPDSLGRTRLLPSCRNFSMRVFDEESKTFVLGRPKTIFESGVKEILRLGTPDTSLRCSREHRVLTPDGWTKAGDLVKGDYLLEPGLGYPVSEWHRIPKRLREGIGLWTTQQRGRLIRNRDECYMCGVVAARDELELDHVTPVVECLKLALDDGNLRPICRPCHGEKVKLEQGFATRYGSRVEAKPYRLDRSPIVISEEMTYDIEMTGPHHNFVADGKIVHNSVNEESGRYSKMRGDFFYPDHIRMQKGKPGAYTFERIEDLALYDEFLVDVEEANAAAWRVYVKWLDKGLAKEQARIMLPLNLYTEVRWTSNARSLMNFLALRNNGHAMYEIRSYAAEMEKIFARYMPTVHSAFVANERVAP